MWDCEKCGTQAIAGSLGFCPTCREPKPPEDVAAELGKPEPGPESGSGDPLVPPEGDAKAPSSPRPRKKGSSGDGQDNE